MTEVFLSYKSEDRERLRPLVAAFEASGISVWWDARVEGGSAWREAIQQRLEAAKVVLVAWSQASVGPKGRFVRDEASRSLERGTYLPLLIDEVRLPIGFGEVQALSLVGWKGNAHDPSVDVVLSAVRARLSQVEISNPHPGDPRQPHLTLTRRGVIAAGGVALLGASAATWYWKSRSATNPNAETGIAVLPFADMSEKKDQEYFSNGLAEELRDALRRIAALKVIGRDSCEQVKTAAARDVAAKLSVGYVLTGSVRRTQSHLRVSCQLINGLSGEEVWSNAYDRALGDAIEIQTGIAESIAQALRIRLGASEKNALQAGGTTNAEAHDLYLRGSFYASTDLSEETNRRTLSLAEAAIALDPNYFDARILRVWALGELANNAQTAQAAEDLLNKSKQEALRAIAAAPGLPRGYSQLANVLFYQLDLPGTFEQLKRAFKLSGERDRPTLQMGALFLSGAGQPAEAVDLATRAVSLDPLNVYPYYQLSIALYYSRRYPQAIENFKHTLALAPKWNFARVNLGACQLLMNQNDAARATFQMIGMDDPVSWPGFALLAARTGDRDSALKQLAQIRARDAGDTVAAAEILAQMGDKEAAVAALDQAWDTRYEALAFIAVDPWLDPLRTDARFASLLQKLRIPELQHATLVSG